MAETMGTLEDLRSYFRNKMDCPETVRTQLAQCSAGSYVTARDREGNSFVTDDGLTEFFGLVRVRVRCTDLNGGSYSLDTEYFPLQAKLLRAKNDSPSWRLLNRVPSTCYYVAPPPPLLQPLRRIWRFVPLLRMPVFKATQSLSSQPGRCDH